MRGMKRARLFYDLSLFVVANPLELVAPGLIL